MHTNIKTKVWLVAVEMGYGHLRATHALKKMSLNGVVILGVNDSSSTFEKRLWKRFVGVYSAFSRARSIPIVGKYIFGILDTLFRIPSFYPMRNLSENTFQVNLLESMIRKGLCSGLIENLHRQPQPIVTSFYAAAIAADYAGYENIYCIICDADINRVWVSKDPWESRIIYFAPCSKAAQRLRAYGVSSDRVITTGFPLPHELLGGESLSTLKYDLGQRLHYLDPARRFWRRHEANVEHFLGTENCVFKNDRKLTLMYTVGGAGAQKEIGGKIVRSLVRQLTDRTIKLILVAGTHRKIRDYFEEIRTSIGDGAASIEILYNDSLDDYFVEFENALHATDILWTKPSELSFYCALGIPIIMSTGIGSQEYFNRKWLLEIRAGFKQERPEYTSQWLFDLLRRGRLAEAAWSGFLNARKLGTYKIQAVLENSSAVTDDSPLLR